MFESPVVDVVATSDHVLAGLLRECARWRAQLDAFEAGVLAEFDRRHVASNDGSADTAAWLGRHTQAAAGAARARVERANALAGLPGASAAFRAGALGSDHAAVLARAVAEVGAAAVAADEARLLGWVPGTTPEQFARKVRRWVNTIRVDAGVSPTEAKRAERSVSLRADLVAGTGRVIAELPADEYAVVANALWALVEEQWRAEHGPQAPIPDRVELTSRQRLADALVEMARRAMGASVADGHRARPTVIVVADADTLVGRLSAAGRCELADGTPVTPETARRLACEADVLPVVLDGARQPLDVGRSRRLATAAQRAAMLARSTTCEWPGCQTHAGWCQAHHLDPWESGGTTDIALLAWLCSSHHRLVHEEHWTLQRLTTGQLSPRPPTANQPGGRPPDPSPASQSTMQPAAWPTPGPSPASQPTRHAA